MGVSARPREHLQERHFTEPYPEDVRGPGSQGGRCRLAVGSGPGFTDEMSCLLRTRLRLAILIFLAGFTLHHLRQLLLTDSRLREQPATLFFAGCEIVVMAAVLALLWSPRPLGMRSLRVVELTI